jgi:hypothetical protein
MNVVFISPHFPQQYHRFCAALKERGARVLGLGDTPGNQLSPAVHASLDEYYFARLDDYAEAHRALGYFTWRHGRIDRIDSHNEHWLGLEARLREDFNIPGPRPAQMQQMRTKSGMAELFRKAEVPYPESRLVTSPQSVRDFAKEQGFPLVLKPDLGVGATRTFRLDDAQGLERALREPLEGYLMQPFVQGTIVSYDGLVDAQGRILFETSHVYSHGVMEVVNKQLDVYYYNHREVDPALRTLGARTVDTFGIRERFFHIEFFALPGGGHRALEINVRPPGGFTVDMMNYSADEDLYRLWARMLSGENLADFTFQRRYHVAHVARRSHRPYHHSHAELCARLGERLVSHQAVPPAFSTAMGDEVYLVRDPEERSLLEAIAAIQATTAG